MSAAAGSKPLLCQAGVVGGGWARRSSPRAAGVALMVGPGSDLSEVPVFRVQAGREGFESLIRPGTTRGVEAVRHPGGEVNRGDRPGRHWTWPRTPRGRSRRGRRPRTTAATPSSVAASAARRHEQPLAAVPAARPGSQRVRPRPCGVALDEPTEVDRGQSRAVLHEVPVPLVCGRQVAGRATGVRRESSRSSTTARRDATRSTCRPSTGAASGRPRASLAGHEHRREPADVEHDVVAVAVRVDAVEDVAGIDLVPAGSPIAGPPSGMTPIRARRSRGPSGTGTDRECGFAIHRRWRRRGRRRTGAPRTRRRSR